MNLAEFFSRDMRHLATTALIFGFVADIVTFRNLNLEISLFILAAHLAIVAGTTLILAAPAKGDRPHSFFFRARAWLPIIQQYSTGNLLSAFLILYSASGSLAASWPFFIIVIAAAIGNEVIRLESNRLPLQVALFFLNLTLFAALAVPIALGALGVVPFLIALAVAWVFFSLYLWFGRPVIREAFRARWALLRDTSAAIVALMLFLYFANLIPPIPLSIKDAGFYHSVARNGSAYLVRDEIRPWYERFLDLNGLVLRLAPGEPAYFYSAVFAPARLDTNVVHRWQTFNPARGGWITTHIVEFPILGGRRGGYRGYSIAGAPEPGRYRVSVETTRGQIIGRSYLVVERASSPIPVSEISLP
jgi:hypothetical protein